MKNLILLTLALLFGLVACSKEYLEDRRQGFIPYDLQKNEKQAQEDKKHEDERAFTPSY